MVIGGIGGVNGCLGLMALLATATFAWTKGGEAERLGALLLSAGWLLACLMRLALGAQIDGLPFLPEALDAGGLLLVAVRYSSLWLGPALLSYSGGFALHAVRLGAVDPQPALAPNDVMLHDLMGYVALLAVVGGTVAAMRRRHDRKKGLKAETPRRATFAAAM